MKTIRFLLVACLASFAGCQALDTSSLWNVPTFDFATMEFRSQNPKERIEDGFDATVNTRLIGRYTTVSGLNLITLEGVGLVVGLNGTGGDPPPSRFRTALLTEMRRRKVRNPNQLLRSPDTALVVVRAYLPPLVRKGDRFDVEVRLPEASEAASLDGGWLLETYLSEQAVIPGRGLMKGHMFAKATGPILISAPGSEKDESLAGLQQRGRVLGGGVSTKERDLFLDLRSDFRGYRNVTRIADRIGERFYHYSKHGLREPLAEAKTDQRIVLKIAPRYRENYPRYLQVIRNMDFRETPIKRRVRIQKLKGELLNPETAETAALKLEAVGKEANPVLKAGLQSGDPEVQFHSAAALAYLGETDGLKVLQSAVRNEPAFRIYALAAMSTVEDAEAHLLLRELMSEQSAETCYGAFRALSTLDKGDPFIRGELLNDQFVLHVLNTTGPEMAHLTLRKKAEIVLFGAEQRFRTPVALRAGRSILVTASPRSDRITVSRFGPNQRDQRKIVSTRVADVVRAVAELGATYPDVAQLLTEAKNQHNLQGRLEIDALPSAGRVYFRGARKSADGKSTGGRRTRIGRSSFTPNLFEGTGFKQGGDKDADDGGDGGLLLGDGAGSASVTNLEGGPTDDKSDATSGRKSGNTMDAKSDKKKKPKVKAPPKKRGFDFFGWFGSKTDDDTLKRSQRLTE